MAEPIPTYTGEKAGYRVARPSTEGITKASDTLSDFITRAEKIKTDVFRENAQQLLKNANIDPIFTLNAANTTAQAKMLNEFNNDAIDVLKNGNTQEGQLKLASKKSYIQMQQMKMKEDMDVLQMQQELIRRNPNRYDYGEWIRQRYLPFVNGDVKEFDKSEPPLKPLSLTQAAMNSRNKVATKEFIDPSEAQKTYNVGSVPYKKTTIYSGSKEDVAPYIQASMFDNDQYLAGALLEWSNMPEAEKEQYYTDVNKDGKIDAKDAPSGIDNSANNPIIKAMVDRHWKEWVTSKEKEEKNILPGATNFNNANSVSIKDGNKTISYVPSPPNTLSLGKNYTSNRGYTINNVSAKNIVLKNTGTNPVRVITEGMNSDVKNPPSFSGIPVAYDAEKDNYIFLVNKDFSDIGISGVQAGKDMQIAVPRSAINDTSPMDSYVVKDENGKNVTIGQLSRPATQAIETPAQTAMRKLKEQAQKK